MASTRLAARYFSRRLSSSGGKILGEEEKAAENVYIKKMENAKMEKLARKEHAAQAAKPIPDAGSTPNPPGSSTSTDTNRNYAVVAGSVTLLSGLGWYLLSKPKKTEESQD